MLIKARYLFFLLAVCYFHTAYSKGNIDLRGNNYFIKNVGQVIDTNKHIRTDIDYKLSGNGVILYISAGKLQYQWYNRHAVIAEKAGDNIQQDTVTDIYAMQF